MIYRINAMQKFMLPGSRNIDIQVKKHWSSRMKFVRKREGGVGLGGYCPESSMGCLLA